MASRALMIAVDPRACGVNQGFSVIDEPKVGRSPRMRGKLRSVVFVIIYVGSIPAHAG